jgi:Condensation domain
VGVGTTYSMTIGQLAEYRDTLALPADHAWESNLSFVWDLRQECTVDQVWATFGALAMRHESLRTAYLVDSSGEPRQYLAADDPQAVLALADRGVADITELAALKKDMQEQKIDIHHDLPWRAWVLTDGGAPTKVLFIVHHIAADGAASLILENNFHALLAGEALPAPSGQPRSLVAHEQGVGARRLRSAERHWRRTLEAAPRVLPGARPAGGPMIGATVHTGIPLERAHEGAAALGVSVASVMLAAFYRALRLVTGSSEFLLLPMSANRFDAATATMVTSLSQRVPLLLAFDGDGDGAPGLSPDDDPSFADLAHRVHWKSFNALKNGVCDPDAIARIREEFFELADPPVDPGFNVNTILAPPGFAAPVDPEPPTTEFYVPTCNNRPGFYLVTPGIERIDLIVRSNRADFDRAAIAALLASMQETLQEAAGLVAAVGGDRSDMLQEKA